MCGGRYKCVYHRRGSREGKLYHMVLFPPGSGMECFPGEGLPYGIPSGGTLAIWYNFGGGGGGSHVTPAPYVKPQ